MVANGAVVEGFFRHAFKALDFPEVKYNYSELRELAEASISHEAKWVNIIKKGYPVENTRQLLDQFFKIDLTVDLSTPTTRCRVGVDIAALGRPLSPKQREIISLRREYNDMVVDHHVIIVSTLPRFGGWGGYPPTEKQNVLIKIEDILYSAVEAEIGDIFSVEL
jgi:hypothetical protein